MLSRIKLTSGAALSAVTTAAVVAAITASGSTAAQAPEPSAALTSAVSRAVGGANAQAAPALGTAAGNQRLTTASALESEGRVALSRIALPPGESLSINFAAGAQQGGDNAYGVQSVVEYNAACHWLKYYSATKSSAAVSVLQAIPQWPTMRITDGMPQYFQVLADAAVKGDAAPIDAAVAQNCKTVK